MLTHRCANAYMHIYLCKPYKINNLDNDTRQHG